MTSIPRPLLLVLQEKEKQVLRIRSIFHRQLSVPLANSSATLLAYKSGEVERGAVLDVESSNLDGISSNVASAYQKALEMCNARAHVEEQISRQDLSDSEKFQQYMIYLKYEQSSGDPGRVQLLYERAITDFPVSSDHWLDYTRYLDKTLKVYPSIFYFTSSVAAICILIDSPLQVDGLRWRILFSGEVEGTLDYSFITETFQYFGLQLWHIGLTPASGITLCLAYIPLEFWVSVEWAPTAISVSNVVGRHCTEALALLDRLFCMVDFNPLLLFLGSCLSLRTFLASDRADWCYHHHCGTMLEARQSYISMEIELGHINEARSIDKRCYSRRFTSTGSELKERNKLRKGSEDVTQTIPEEEDGDTAMPDVKNNPKPTTKANSSDSSDASDSDSDSDSEDEAKQNMELQTLEYQLSNEPSNYDTYVQVLNPNSNAMSKIITENASEEFLYSLSNYCGLQKEEEDSCGDDDDVDGEDEIDMIDDEVTKNL
ncbi:EMBRYO DEFECTIVE 140 [Citrus sinensis]|uniref:EMBRYO DEFECTIVE 140 n=1 Tax=Citrus sinensis TaxID=2711 RepID=A0ACB8K6Z2_CITSI|nr:EMBRYO DEFECTIVE 140 [Citrus sinensis]